MWDLGGTLAKWEGGWQQEKEEDEGLEGVQVITGHLNDMTPLETGPRQ